MPQLKHPVSLYNAALSKTRLWLMEISTQICETFGDYDSIYCQQEVTRFNSFMKASLPACVIDELYNSSELLCASKTVTNSQISTYKTQIPIDQRILFSIYINENMKTLNAHKMVNDFFWKSKLPSLTNLLKLDLNKVCTDEILEVVGNYCLSLEFINIVSKSCHMRTKDRHNALKLQLCVSDTGLNFLANCKQLKEIQMTCIIRKGCGGRQITNEGIKSLLLMLPKLCRINYSDTGILLDSFTNENDKLCLVSIIDYHPCAGRIPKFEKLCPHLTELHLTYAFSSDDLRSDVITALSSSGLKISILSLTHFPFNEFLKKFLEIKGVYLKVFNFISSFIPSVNELFCLLGCLCPNLESMHMQFHIFDGGYINHVQNSNQCHSSAFCNGNDNIFTNLKNLVIKGVIWDPKYVLPLVLKNALHIKKVALSNNSYTECLDDTFVQIQQKNPFLNLEAVYFFKGANISFQFFRKFVLACPVLKTIVIESESRSYVKLVDQFQEELMSNNLDINLNMYIVP